MNDESFILSSPEKTTFAFLSTFVTAREDRGASKASPKVNPSALKSMEA